MDRGRWKGKMGMRDGWSERWCYGVMGRLMVMQMERAWLSSSSSASDEDKKQGMGPRWPIDGIMRGMGWDHDGQGMGS